jgi:O6-methylguanine-DNA--protein-cysteine methyltransferase
MANNPLPLLLPCHRVVAVGEAQPKAYMGSAVLAPFKTALLAWEKTLHA